MLAQDINGEGVSESHVNVLSEIENYVYVLY